MKELHDFLSLRTDLKNFDYTLTDGELIISLKESSLPLKTNLFFIKFEYESSYNTFIDLLGERKVVLLLDKNSKFYQFPVRYKVTAISVLWDRR